MPWSRSSTTRLPTSPRREEADAEYGLEGWPPSFIIELKERPMPCMSAEKAPALRSGERDPSRTAVLHDAFVDGSSVVCTRCNALVARSRWTAHSTMWCDALESGGSDDEESD